MSLPAKLAHETSELAKRATGRANPYTALHDQPPSLGPIIDDDDDDHNDLKKAALSFGSSGTGGAGSDIDDAYLDDEGQFVTFSWLRLVALTIIFAGAQFVWTVEMGYGTPYLKSMGLSEASLSLAWLAGPLSGLIMQPVIGSWSDSCRAKLGRRRPFIIAGSLVIIFSLMVIAYGRDLCRLLHLEKWDSETASMWSICLVVGGFYLMDFSINAVQACGRSLIVDVLSTSQQNRGHAFASIMIAAGNVIGYYAYVLYVSLY